MNKTNTKYLEIRLRKSEDVKKNYEMQNIVIDNFK